MRLSAMLIALSGFVSLAPVGGQDPDVPKFLVPLSGEIQVRAAFSIDVTGRIPETIAEVAELRSTAEHANWSDEDLTSWRFLQTYHWTRRPKEHVTNSGVPYTPYPDWRSVDVVFDGDRAAHRETSSMHSTSVISTPRADIVAREPSKDRAARSKTEVNHYYPGAASERKLGALELFGRSAKLNETGWVRTGEANGASIFEKSIPDRGSIFVIASPSGDEIWARGGIVQGEMAFVSVFIGLRDVGHPSGVKIPKTTIKIDADSPGFVLEVYQIDDVRLDVPIDPKEFEYLTKPGELYAAYGPSMEGTSVEIGEQTSMVNLPALDPSEGAEKLVGVSFEHSADTNSAASGSSWISRVAMTVGSLAIATLLAMFGYLNYRRRPPNKTP